MKDFGFITIVNVAGVVDFSFSLFSMDAHLGSISYVITMHASDQRILRSVHNRYVCIVMLQCIIALLAGDGISVILSSTDKI